MEIALQIISGVLTILGLCQKQKVKMLSIFTINNLILASMYFCFLRTTAGFIMLIAAARTFIFAFYAYKKIKPNLNYLKNKLIESNILDKDAVFTIDILKEMLVQRFKQIDFKQVRDDAQKFVMKNEDLSLYCKELFIDCVNKM